MDNAQFRLDFPEFADVSRFPDSALNFWAGIGEKLINSDKFGDLYSQALNLFTAHNITLAAGNVQASANGGLPGNSGGIVSSKTVGSVSISYDTGAAMLTNAGHWNQTVYGRQYIQLVRLMATGCVQL